MERIAGRAAEWEWGMLGRKPDERLVNVTMATQNSLSLSLTHAPVISFSTWQCEVYFRASLFFIPLFFFMWAAFRGFYFWVSGPPQHHKPPDTRQKRWRNVGFSWRLVVFLVVFSFKIKSNHDIQEMSCRQNITVISSFINQQTP